MTLDELKRRLENAGLDPSLVNGPGPELDLYAHNVVKRHGYWTSYVTDGRDTFYREFTTQGKKVKFATEEAAYDYLWAELTAPTPEASRRPGKSPEALDEQRAYSRAQLDAQLAKRGAKRGRRREGEKQFRYQHWTRRGSMPAFMEIRQLLNLIQGHYGAKGSDYFFSSTNQTVECILYETFPVRFTIQEHGNFGGMVLLGGDRAASRFFGKQLSLNSDEGSISSSLDVVERWCRLHLTEAFLHELETSAAGDDEQ